MVELVSNFTILGKHFCIMFTSSNSFVSQCDTPWTRLVLRGICPQIQISLISESLFDSLRSGPFDLASRKRSIKPNINCSSPARGVSDPQTRTQLCLVSRTLNVLSQTELLTGGSVRLHWQIASQGSLLLEK